MRGMKLYGIAALAALLLAPLAVAEVTEATIIGQLKTLRAVPEAQRPAAIVHIAGDIHTLPSGLQKLKLADALSHLATEGDMGRAALQATADVLSEALVANPLAAKDNAIPMPYSDLARLVRYEHVTTALTDPLYLRAGEELKAEEAEIEKADFTLQDLHGNKVTLSSLRGKYVMVNFWATWCPPCRIEISALDELYTRLQSHGLVVLSITNEPAAKVEAFLASRNYHPTVLLDPEGSVAKQFHISGLPHNYLFSPEGKLVGVAIDARSGDQFQQMFTAAGLK